MVTDVRKTRTELLQALADCNNRLSARLREKLWFVLPLKEPRVILSTLQKIEEEAKADTKSDSLAINCIQLCIALTEKQIKEEN